MGFILREIGEGRKFARETWEGRRRWRRNCGREHGAVKVGADGIVSGDRHLLDLGEHRGIRILTVREFLEELEGNRPGGEQG